jgi:hypothetical protein
VIEEIAPNLCPKCGTKLSLTPLSICGWRRNYRRFDWCWNCHQQWYKYSIEKEMKEKEQSK